MSKSIFYRMAMFAAFAGAFGVIFGAFGAHALKERLPEHDLETLRAGVLYLFVHALAAMGVALAGIQTQLVVGSKLPEFSFCVGPSFSQDRCS